MLSTSRMTKGKGMQMKPAVAMVISLLLTTSGLSAAEPETAANQTSASAAQDHRQLVEMPEQARRFMRADMQDHLAGLSQILGLLAEGKLEQAGDVAEKRLGRASMGRHRGTGMGPGRFMPAEMRDIGMSMHDAASEFADMAMMDDEQAAYRALHKVTNACVACHYSYRTR